MPQGLQVCSQDTFLPRNPIPFLRSTVTPYHYGKEKNNITRFNGERVSFTHAYLLAHTLARHSNMHIQTARVRDVNTPTDGSRYSPPERRI